MEKNVLVMILTCLLTKYVNTQMLSQHNLFLILEEIILYLK